MSSNLSHPTLILNKNWHPIDACTAKEALVDVFADKAQILCPETYQLFNIEEWIKSPVTPSSMTIQSVNCEIKVPKFIVNRYNKIPKKTVIFSRSNLWRRDNYTCQYCGVRPPPDEITVDHVNPRSKGGITSFENCVLACISCNKSKNNRTPEEANMPLRRKRKLKNGNVIIEMYNRPQKPKWDPRYAVYAREIPVSWSKFIQHMVDELYWNSELEP